MDSISPIRNQIAAIESRPWARRVLRLGIWLLAIGYFVFALLLLVLRYGVLPNIENYRDNLQHALSAALHRPVAIDRIEGSWQGLRPRLDLYGLRIQDGSGQTALSLEHVDAVVGWTSLIYLRPRLYRLEIAAPDLAIRRARDGHLFVAGLPADQSPDSGGGGGFGDWLLDQVEIVVSDARVTWTDDLRGAPPLAMQRVNFRLDNSFRRHRFGLAFEPPADIAGRVDFRGDLHGHDLNDPASWHGQVYAQVGYIDLAIWRTWVDYPLELPQGRGALRVWLDFAKARPTGLIADVALANTRIRLARDLKMLDLDRIDGRVQGKLLEDGFESSVSHLSLATHEGLQLKPADASLRWQTHEGEFDASTLDLSTLNQLSAYLPLPPQIRKPLTEYAPGGQISGLKLGWSGKTRDFEQYHIAARFQDLRLDPQGEVPGFSGLSGKVSGDESGGQLEISAKDGELNLPAFLGEPRVPVAALSLQGGWRRRGSDTEFSILKAELRNADADGSVSGSYRRHAGGASVIDLSANLNHLDAKALWRYLPRKVNADAVSWLHRSVLEGLLDGVTLKLRGDLDHFPFADKSGTFHIAGNIHGGVLRFASEWPQIDDIAGTVELNGPHITISAEQGRIMDVALKAVKAEIPNMDAADTVFVTGRAAGATESFLKYIEVSPVGKNIDHATANMSALGTGELQLKLDIPVRHASDTKVSGSYRFDGDHLVPDPDLPGLDDVHGQLDFNAAELTVKAAQVRLLGGPARVDLKTLPDGALLVTAGGELIVTQLRQQMPHPLFEHLAGSTRWNGTLRIKKKFAEVRIASTLQGISSSLPAPFNKTAGDSMPVLFEHKLPELPRPAGRRPREAVTNFHDQIELGIGRALRLRIMHHAPGVAGVQDRGTIAIGDASPKWPDKGVILAANWDRFDADFWWPIISAKTGAGGEGLGITQIELHAGEAVIFSRLLHDLRVSGPHQAPVWSFDLKTREVIGKFDWTEGEPGKLSGHISQFNAPDPLPGRGEAPEDTQQQLPNIDLAFDRFTLHGIDFGKLSMAAENKGGNWNAIINAQNDDANLSGQGRWRAGPDASDSHFDFKLKTTSIEKTLGRVGYPNTVRRGNATFEGSLSWNGPPYALDYPSLDGNLKLRAEKGQFNKLEPGVGRLLGILSLQTLPRRITLDFRDIFSEGFAFDSIAGTGKVTRGVIDTRDMEINGPAARVQMAGTIDLARETQDLKVRVQPSVSATFTTGALIANPAVGAGVWLFNKVFGSPFDRAFAFDYAVTGDWTNPKVDKVGAQAGAAVKKDAEK